MNETYEIIAPKISSYIFPLALLAFFIFLCAASIGIMHYMKNAVVTVNDDYLIIKSIFYGRTIKRENINADGVRKINLIEENQYNIRSRTNGIGLPGYYAGWMKLNNGNRALVFLTDRENALLIPVSDYDILITVNNAETLANLLRN